MIIFQIKKAGCYRMKFSSNIIFKTNRKYIFENLKNNNVFMRNIDLLIFAMAIGINKNKLIEPQGEDQIEIASATLTNYEVMDSINFLFETAILSCEAEGLKLNEDQRMKLAFDPEFELKGFDKMTYLLGFATYGLEVIEKEIYSISAEEVIENIFDFSKNMIIHDELSDEVMDEIIQLEIDDFIKHNKRK